MMDNRKLLSLVGRKTVMYMQSKLRTGRAPYGSKNATNTLTRSIKYKVVGDTLDITMIGYGRYVQSGRRAGARMPPVNEIEKWVKVRGIRPNKGGTTRGLSFAIAKSIKEKGIRPFDFAPPSIHEIINDIRKEFTITISKEFTDEIHKQNWWK